MSAATKQCIRKKLRSENVACTCSSFNAFHMQTLLLTKSVVVALLGDDNVLPEYKAGQEPSAGLVFIFLPIILGAFFSIVQNYAARSLLVGML